MKAGCLEEGGRGFTPQIGMNGSMLHQELPLMSVHLDNVGEDVIRLCQERNHTV